MFRELVSGMLASPQAEAMRSAHLEAGRDAQLEAAIDEVGRERVFAMAWANGWFPPAAPPKWVWWQIVERLRGEDNG